MSANASKYKIIAGQPLPKMPWEDRPKIREDVVWRCSRKPHYSAKLSPAHPTASSTVPPSPSRATLPGCSAATTNSGGWVYMPVRVDGFKWNISPNPSASNAMIRNRKMGIWLRPPRLLDRRPLLHHVVQRISRPNHRHRLDQGFQNLSSTRKRLSPLQPQRGTVSAKDQRQFHDAQPAERSGPHPVRRNVPQPKPRPDLLGQAPFRHGPQTAVGIDQNRQPARSPWKPAKAGFSSIMAC